MLTLLTSPDDPMARSPDCSYTSCSAPRLRATLSESFPLIEHRDEWGTLRFIH
jgi:hypothetical protein